MKSHRLNSHLTEKVDPSKKPFLFIHTKTIENNELLSDVYLTSKRNKASKDTTWLTIKDTW